MEKTSSRQLLIWNAYLDEEWNEKTKLDSYLASIRQDIDRLGFIVQQSASSKRVRRKIKKLDKYYVTFVVGNKKKRKSKLSPEDRMKRMKFAFGLMLQAPPPEAIMNQTLGEAKADG
jgi:hypothetical protein